MEQLISQQAAIDALDEQIEQCDKSLSSFDISLKDEFAVKVERASLVAFRETLEYLPSAQPEPKKGKWIGYNTDKEGWNRTDGSPVFMSCSECGGTVLNNGSAHWNYCPNCGADMRGGQDE